MSELQQGEYHSDGDEAADDTGDKTDQIKTLLKDIHRGVVENVEDRIDEHDLLPFGGECDEGKDNILHCLANFINEKKLKRNVDIQPFKSLVQIVLERDWRLMEAGDKDGKTALCIGIEEGKIRLIQLFLSVARKLQKSLTKTIAKAQHNSKRTCLHEVIAKQLWQVSHRDVKDLLDLCDEETVKGQDSNGQTALHFAVKYENFCHLKDSEAPKQIAQMLVEKCAGLLNCKSSEGLTPLQLLRQDRRDLIKKREQALKFTKTESRDKFGREPLTRGIHFVPEEQRLESKLQSMRDDESQTKRQNEAVQGSSETKGKVADIKELALRDKVKRRGSYLDGGEPPSVVEERGTKAALQNTAKKISAARNAATTTDTTAQIQDPTANKALNYEQALTAFNQVEDYLTWMTFRFNPNDVAREIIYGGKPGIELDFNLLGVKRLLDAKEIKETYKFLQFGKALQYVALPMLRQVAPPIAPIKRRLGKRDEAQDDSRLMTPNQYVEIFSWLRSTRGVKNVLEIIIQDDFDNPHSDSDIQKAVADLGVEIWNWRKYDISSDTIVQTAPRAREVYLYTTGKKAVLREWSGEDGLRRLKDLQRVVLYVSGIETGPNKAELCKDVQENLVTFKSRLLGLLERDRKAPLIPKQKLADLLQAGEYKDAEINSEHLIEKIRSLQAAKLELLSKQEAEREQTEKPTDIIVLNWYPIVSLQSSSDGQFLTFGKHDQLRAHRWIEAAKNCARWVSDSIGDINEMDRIKVALIDDGVDASHDALHSILKMGATYCTARSGDRQIASSFYASTTGHGTLMAMLIRLVCPFVDLYVAKLDDHKRNASSQFTAKSAAMAIDWAADMKVDVISMSWTIDLADQMAEADKVMGDMTKALRKANDSNIIMVCAARDEGIETPGENGFPAAGTDKIFKVGASAPSGVGSDRTNKAAVDYLFPGTELREASPEFKFSEMPVVDGSSSATALASGLVALLLFILARNTDKSRAKSARRFDQIKNILDGVVNKKYVQVWSLFQHFTPKGSEGDSKRLQELVDSLYHRGIQPSLKLVH